MKCPQAVEGDTKHIAIVGGGIVGCATAYYARQISPTVCITIIDKVGIAAAASGRAGGFLARDWHSGPEAELAALSFGLHKDLIFNSFTFFPE